MTQDDRGKEVWGRRVEPPGAEAEGDATSPRIPREVLEFHDVTVRYGPVVAVRELTGWVGSGEVVALLGSNGSGKSTVLKAASGLVPAATGRIAFCGQWVQKWHPQEIVRLGLVQIPQGRMVFGDQSVEANLLIGAHSRGRTGKAVREDLEIVLERFPILADRRRQPAGTLSGGEQQMLAIARGLMARPRMLMLDEPSLGLAPILQEQLFTTLRSLADLGLGILVVEQLAHLALEIADRGYVLDRGDLVAWGTPAQLRSSGHLVEAYLGRGSTS